MHTNNGLIFIIENLAVPHSLRKSMLELIHEANFDVEMCKKKARVHSLWIHIMYPKGMNLDVEKIVSGVKYVKNLKE